MKQEIEIIRKNLIERISKRDYWNQSELKLEIERALTESLLEMNGQGEEKDLLLG